MKKTIIWFLAIFSAVALAFYQRISGPTYPIKAKENVADNSFQYRLQRSAQAYKDLTIEVSTDSQVELFLSYQILNSSFPKQQIRFIRTNNLQKAVLKGLPPAGKIAYQIYFQQNKEQYFLLSGKPVVVRFKASVSSALLILHVLFMFLTPILCLASFLYYLQKNAFYRKLFLLAILALIIGGFILGPLVQKAAFGVYWSGFPFGNDLTDNKTLILLIVWLFVFFRLKKQPALIYLAVIFLLLNFLIPHSLFGSEYDFQTGSLKK